ncbi:MAG: hypothetical protein R2882_15725 [Gemmatimonadales bacterium]
MTDSSPGGAAPRWSVSLPLLIAAIGLLAAIVFLLLVEPRVARRSSAAAIEQASVDLDGDLEAVNRRLESVEGVVERLAVDVSALIQATADSVLSAAFEDRTRLRRNGMVGPVAGQFDFRRDAGDWVRRSTGDDPDLRALYGGAMMALEGVRAIADSSLPRIWVIGLDGGEAAITPYDSTYFFQNDGDNDYRGTDWLERTRPAPGGAPRASWLASFYTDGLNRWLVSVGAPLLLRGAWWGSVGVDADIGKLLGGDGHFERSPAEIRIYSASGVPVYAPGPEQTLTLGLDRTLLDRLHTDSVPAPFDLGDRIVLVRPIPAADWLVVATFFPNGAQKRRSAWLRSASAAGGSPPSGSPPSRWGVARPPGPGPEMAGRGAAPLDGGAVRSGSSSCSRTGSRSRPPTRRSSTRCSRRPPHCLLRARGADRAPGPRPRPLGGTGGTRSGHGGHPPERVGDRVERLPPAEGPGRAGMPLQRPGRRNRRRAVPPLDRSGRDGRTPPRASVRPRAEDGSGRTTGLRALPTTSTTSSPPSAAMPASR